MTIYDIYTDVYATIMMAKCFAKLKQRVATLYGFICAKMRHMQLRIVYIVCVYIFAAKE